METVSSLQPLLKVTFAFVQLDILVIIAKSIHAAHHLAIMAANVLRTEVGLYVLAYQDSADRHVTQLHVITVLA